MTNPQPQTQDKPKAIRIRRMETIKFRGVIHHLNDVPQTHVIRQRNRDVAIMQRIQNLQARAGESSVQIRHSVMAEREKCKPEASSIEALAQDMYGGAGMHIWVEATALV